MQANCGHSQKQANSEKDVAARNQTSVITPQSISLAAQAI